MNLRVDNINNKIAYRGVLDAPITMALRACDTNEMVNAVGLDVGAMVLPRTYYDTKNRNEFAGAETFFREISGTFINCLSAGLLAQFFSKLYNKTTMPNIKTNDNNWFTDDSLQTLKAFWDKDKNTKSYVQNVLNNIQGRDGHQISEYKNINWKNVEWIDEAEWGRIDWKNPEFKGIWNDLKTPEGITNALEKVIDDKTIAETDRKNIIAIVEKRITNALGANRDCKLGDGKHFFEGTLSNILRDACDMGKDILTNKEVNAEEAIEKVIKVNKKKGFSAIVGACMLGLTNQYINRKITEKRTGKKGFVGDMDYTTGCQGECKKDNFLLLKKIGASVLMAGMVFSVMRVKNFKDFAKKLEFRGPITSGNAIKTVYAANIIGRFMAADNGTELRESMTRDYLGFLNWLVFGGFAAKGVANLLDKKGESLFNYSKEGKGIKHWLNNMTLKTHNEVAAKGKEFAKKNIWKLNTAHAAGIAYSAITLGILLPMLNAKITEHKFNKKNKSVVV